MLSLTYCNHIIQNNFTEHQEKCRHRSIKEVTWCWQKPFRLKVPILHQFQHNCLSSKPSKIKANPRWEADNPLKFSEAQQWAHKWRTILFCWNRWWPGACLKLEPFCSWETTTNRRGSNDCWSPIITCVYRVLTFFCEIECRYLSNEWSVASYSQKKSTEVPDFPWDQQKPKTSTPVFWYEKANSPQ